MTLLVGSPNFQDTVDLQDTSASHQVTDPEDAQARITLYRGGAKIGECWFENNGEEKQNDVVIPEPNVVNYQVKWESLSGDNPINNSVAVSTWQALSAHFYVEWEQTTEGESSGTVTVSIRLGTDPSVLDTAIWDGSAVVEGA